MPESVNVQGSHLNGINLISLIFSGYFSISMLKGFSQDFERGCPKWNFDPFCVIMGAQLSLFSIVNSEMSGCPKSE